MGKNVPCAIAVRRSVSSDSVSMRLALEVAVEQGRVLGLLDDGLDEGRPGVLVLLGRLAGQQADDAGDRAAVDDGPVRGPGVTERAATRLDGRGEVGAGLVEVGHDDGAGHADGRALTPEQRDGPVDVVGARDDEDGGVGGPQPGAQVADEVGVAGGVEEVEGDRTGRRTRRR